MTELLHQWLHLPIDASTHGHEIDRLIYFLHILMVVLFIGWGAFLTYLLVRFRKSRQPKADYTGVKSHASSYLEGVIVVIEVLLLAAFSIPFWAKKVSAANEPPADALRIRVVAQTFVWNIHYPGKDGKFGTTRLDENYNEKTNPLGLDRKSPGGADDITTINQLRIPVGKPVVLEITSRDVIHSVAIPLLRVKQDAIPGMSIPMQFTANKTSEEVAEHYRRTLKLPTKLNAFLYKVTEEVKDKDGRVLLKKNARVPKDYSELVAAGVTELSVVPADPIEIVCGQLCGNGHYNMKGFVQILTPEAYQQWLQDEHAELFPDEEE
jgi:cytochrome c oxidase subunit 2